MKLATNLPIAIIIVFMAFQVFGQNQTPIVQNVTFSQRTDGTFKVDIYYSVNNPEGTTMIVSMKASSDNGQNWDFTCPSITGDLGPWITNGTNKHIVWDFAADHPNTFNDQIRIKILADDGGIPCLGQPTVYDSRNGKTYNTVQIGTQCWLRENLDLGTMINGSLNQTNNSPTNIIEKYCYDNIEANCSAYGGLYQWNEAMKYNNANPQGICPDGWHIPTYTQLQTLAAAVGSNNSYALQALWQSINGTNTSGYSALLAGYRDPYGNFYGLGDGASFWSSTEDNATVAYYMSLGNSGSNITLSYYGKGHGFSVRCLKD